MNKLITYKPVQTALNRLDCNISPAEVHGVMCGMLAVDIAVNQQHCFNELWDEQSIDPEALQHLQQLFEQSRQQFNDSNLHFDCLLPSDDIDLAKRLFAIQEWGQGLLYGAALAGLKQSYALPEDSREFIADVTQISSSGDLDLENDEAAECAYSDIVEYMRIGTLLLCEELQPSKLDTAIH
jgi:uncharacterized protein YgfB (UPF0149 family)